MLLIASHAKKKEKKNDMFAPLVPKFHFFFFEWGYLTVVEIDKGPDPLQPRPAQR